MQLSVIALTLLTATAMASPIFSGVDAGANHFEKRQFVPMPSGCENEGLWGTCIAVNSFACFSPNPFAAMACLGFCEGCCTSSGDDVCRV